MTLTLGQWLSDTCLGCQMTSDDPISRLAEQLRSLLPRDAMPTQMQDELRLALQTVLAHSDLVTRDEFEAQAAVLRRTREKLDALEKQLAELEAAPDEAAG